jgi:hypothetical protein
MTSTVVPIDESQAKEAAIDTLIVFAESRMQQEQDKARRARYGRAIDGLIAFEHELRLCGCPDEVYEAKHEP